MRWAKFTAIASLWAFFFAFIVLVHLWISVLRIPNRWEIISRLTCSLTLLLRRILNIKLTLVGDADGIVLGSIFPAVFVTKREVKKWPVVGLWTTVCGTIFVNRRRKDLVM